MSARSARKLPRLNYAQTREIDVVVGLMKLDIPMERQLSRALMGDNIGSLSNLALPALSLHMSVRETGGSASILNFKCILGSPI